MRDLQMTRQEELEMFEAYIPQYFEDDAPLSIMMADTLMYTPGDDTWRIYDVKKITEEEAKIAPSCGVLLHNFYIGADGMVAPCMGMCDNSALRRWRMCATTIRNAGNAGLSTAAPADAAIPC